MAAWESSGDLELSFVRVHPEIPAPKVGYQPDWDKAHAHFSNVKMDHRACPAINIREQLGVTLYMPYTFRLFRDGRLEVDTWWEEGGPSVFSATPKEGLKFDDQDGKDVEGKLVGRRFPLPRSPLLRVPIGIFTLGDMRLQAWIFDSGIKLNGVPSDCVMLITPPPNHQYPPGYKVGQAVASARLAQENHLNLPIDFDLRQLSPEQEFVQIERGTPVCQYVPVRIPRISLRDEG